MSTTTAISEALAGLGAPPPGLPDEATLARLASALFAELPGGGAAANAAPPAAPPALDRVPAVDATAAALPTAPAIPALPAAPELPAVPALGGGGIALPGVPPVYATALPAAAAPTGGLPTGTLPPATPPAAAPAPASSPYYFLAEAGPRALPAAPVATVPELPLAPPGIDLAELASLALRPGGARPPAPAEPRVDGRFYFVDAVPAGVIAPSAHPPFDVNGVRRDFPILAERVNGRPLIWLDNAATTQKPQVVIDRLAHFYAHENSNIHRAAHALAARATDAYEKARRTVARFLGAGSVDEIVFVRGATEAINLVAKSWGWQHVGEGDEIVVSQLEHHANIVPWQQLAAARGATLRVIPVDDSGQILLGEYRRLLNGRTRLVAVTQVSNALGTITPVAEIVELAHRAGARVLVDGAQAVSHLRVDVKALDADFYVFSGHKVFAPTGIGVVYGKAEVLEDMPPWQGGGNMIRDVTFERTLYQPPPGRFEAGTGNIADAVGLGAALDYLERLGLENVARYEHELLEYATDGLRRVPGLRLIGTAQDKTSVLSFVLDGYRPEEVGSELNREGIAVRAGHHCAQPILRRFGLEATVRPSLAFYNTCEEVDTLLRVLRRLAR
ncbi:cysteine desulfurase /L-selenocysteine selenide-lyase (L-alanine-forming) [Plasticicumulans lactativorans]|uniref:cysteine desulfurase n=1 Tax=Plasticicumulans lactativorans TaxID=1133106 RepID=A0A4R2LCL5_9GAMM|nr:family 2A encapsulin nanocompartment cargo protein cysteine desulfurase [Plasticicumulans lactativorans]TCO80588.1 cysteine desulfurase /L-selenocysteine selenide-lyase (L-alanine-forming) [Plasticicumulans lactativorans]